VIFRIILAVTIIPQERFIFHRFLTDAIGHLIGSYLSVLLSYGIDPHSDRPRAFSHGFALALAGSFILADFFIARSFGNRKWFGLAALVGASITGTLLFMFCSEVYLAATGAGCSACGARDIIGALVVAFVFCLPPALTFPLIIRLMAYPIIGVFRPNE